jgi:hypothetical protein
MGLRKVTCYSDDADLTDNKSCDLHQERIEIAWTLGRPGPPNPANGFSYRSSQYS